MKKFILCILAFACCFAFAGCQDNGPSSSGPNGEQTSGEEVTGNNSEIELPRLDF